MLLRPRLTFDDFCAIVKDGEKADLIDGVIYMASPENTEANAIFMWLGTLMNCYVEEKDLGKVYGTRVAYRLDEHNGPEPDIGFVKKSRLKHVRRGSVDGPPDLAVEIVSPGSVERDYEKKRRLYERTGVAEYWIIDEIEKKTTLLRLSKNGVYKEIPPRNGIFRSKVMKGFWLRESWLWQERLPRPLKTLRAIMRSARCIMNVLEKIGSYTFTDFCRLVKDGEKADLIDGVIYMASPDNPDANTLFVWLIGLVSLFVEEKNLGEVYGSRAAFRLSEKSSPEPDIAFVKKAQAHLARRGYFDGEPDLAIEIVSPDSVERDYKKKRKLYQNFGTAEYWIIDEVQETVTMLRLGPDRKVSRSSSAKRAISQQGSQRLLVPRRLVLATAVSADADHPG